MEPLRIGVLGCAQITDLSLIQPARSIGARLVAVAARDPQRARRFADQHGIERALHDYQSLLEDPDVEVVYNPLVNAWHAPLNDAALRAGKHVLCEKPFASNADEASATRDLSRQLGRHAIEALHYSYHPLAQRTYALIAEGAIGEVLEVSASLTMPPPPSHDARWARELSGGATMDLGCYGLHSLRMLAPHLEGEPQIVTATAETAQDPGIDVRMDVTLIFPNGVPGRVHANMSGSAFEFTWKARGTEGTLEVPAFIWPHADDRLMLTRGRNTRVEHLGTRSSYTYQLEAMTCLIRHGQPMLSDADDAVKTMELIDAVYTAAGLRPRPATLGAVQ